MDNATYKFTSSAAAWCFMRACDDAGISAGFPSVDGLHTVQVAIPTWMVRERADKIVDQMRASGAPVEVSDYKFATEVAS